MRVATYLILILLLAACSKEDKVSIVASDDPEMNAAIAKARASLPQFWREFNHPEQSESGFSLKVRISDQGKVEHFWTIDIKRQGDKIIGTINNDAEMVKTVKLGDTVEIPETNITDWLYIRNGKMVGNFTIRPLLKHVSREEADRIKGMMADP